MNFHDEKAQVKSREEAVLAVCDEKWYIIGNEKHKVCCNNIKQKNVETTTTTKTIESRVSLKAQETIIYSQL